MLRNDRQAAACARALLAPVGLHALWTAYGPTPRAEKLYAANGAGLSESARALLLLSFALWNGTRAMAACGAWLDAERLADVGKLLAAVEQGSEAVNAWLVARGEAVALPDLVPGEEAVPAAGVGELLAALGVGPEAVDDAD